LELENFKRKYNTCVLTFLYEASLPFFNEFIHSLLKQTYAYFDLIIILDYGGLLNIDLFDLEYKTLIIKSQSTISKNREFGLNLVKKLNYDYVILCDSDDFMSNNRLEVVTDYLKSYDIVINDLNLFGNKNIKNYLSHKLKNNEIITYSYIKDSNFLGFSNTAFSTKIYDNINFDDKLKIVDWYFFYKMLLEKNKTIFTNEAITFYRIWGPNLIGNDINKDKILSILNHKLKHFDLIRQKYPNLEEIKKYYDYYFKLDLLLKEKNNLSDYIIDYFIKRYKVIQNPFWLEEIIYDEKIANQING